jgi:putative transposase
VGFIKWKRKGDTEAFTASQSVRVKGQAVYIDGIGWVTARIYKSIGIVKRVTVQLHPNGKVYASILYESGVNPKPVPEHINPENTLGIDLGLKSLLVTSKGAQVEPPRNLARNLELLAKLQRRVSRSKKGSKRYKRRQRQVAECHRKISATRAYYHHLTAFRLTTGQMRHESQVSPHAIVMENLQVRNMVKNKRLARAISDAGWSLFRTAVKHHAHKRGVVVIEVPPHRTSKECSTPNCGYVKPDLTLAIRSWTCPTCHTVHDRDVNAARNIQRRGLVCIKERELKTQTGNQLTSEGKPEYTSGLSESRVLDTEVTEDRVAKSFELLPSGRLECTPDKAGSHSGHKEAWQGFA